MFAKADNPAEKAIAITPDDDTVLPDGLRGFYVGGAGDVSVVSYAGDTVTFVGVPVGVIIPLRITRVRATSTTATNIVALG